MSFVSKSKSGKSKLPDNQLVIKVKTSKGYVTLAKAGLFMESALHCKVAQLTNEQLQKLISQAEVTIIPYSNGNDSDDIELII